MKAFLLATAVLTLAPAVARADQCQWVAPDAAVKARAALAAHPDVIEFCEPCGDKVPGTPIRVRDVAATTPQDGYEELALNGDAIDLAYTYVRTSPSHYENLAMLVGCPVDGVSPSLAVADETDNGVMITADPTPVDVEDEAGAVAPETVIPEPTTVSPPPDPAPTHITYYATTVEQPLPWLLLALAGAAGFVAGASCLVLGLALGGRRRAMRPRASELR